MIKYTLLTWILLTFKGESRKVNPRYFFIVYAKYEKTHKHKIKNLSWDPKPVHVCQSELSYF